jgi:chromosome segregation ATPase
LLAFSDSYNAYNNKVIVQSTLKTEAEALEAHIASLKAEHDTELEKLQDKDLATDKAIADLDTKYLAEVEKLVASDQAGAEDLADLKTAYESKVAILETADSDNKQSITTVQNTLAELNTVVTTKI